jgi:hypothetical protein
MVDQLRRTFALTTSLRINLTVVSEKQLHCLETLAARGFENFVDRVQRQATQKPGLWVPFHDKQNFRWRGFYLGEDSISPSAESASLMPISYAGIYVHVMYVLPSSTA